MNFDSSTYTSNTVTTTYDSIRNFGIFISHTFGFSSMINALDCTDFNTYTPAYEGPTTLL